MGLGKPVDLFRRRKEAATAETKRAHSVGRGEARRNEPCQRSPNEIAAAKPAEMVDLIDEHNVDPARRAAPGLTMRSRDA